MLFSFFDQILHQRRSSGHPVMSKCVEAEPAPKTTRQRKRGQYQIGSLDRIISQETGQHLRSTRVAYSYEYVLSLIPQLSAQQQRKKKTSGLLLPRHLSALIFRLSHPASGHIKTLDLLCNSFPTEPPRVQRITQKAAPEEWNKKEHTHVYIYLYISSTI